MLQVASDGPKRCCDASVAPRGAAQTRGWCERRLSLPAPGPAPLGAYAGAQSLALPTRRQLLSLAKLLEKRVRAAGASTPSSLLCLGWAGSLRDPRPRASSRQEGRSPPLKILSLPGTSLQGSRAGRQWLIRICPYPLTRGNPFAATREHAPNPGGVRAAGPNALPGARTAAGVCHGG